MGAEVYLKVGQLSLLWWKNQIDKKVLGIFFTKSNLIINNTKSNENNENKNQIHEIKYTNSISNVIDRLNAIGYTLKNFEKEFNAKKYDILDYYEILFNLNTELDDYEQVINNRINKYVTFKKFSNSMKKYVKYFINNYEDTCSLWEGIFPQEISPKNECDKIIFNSISSYNSDSYWGCFCNNLDIFYIIRQILEFCDKNNNIEIDLTELVDSGYASIDDIIVNDEIEKTIILVEGTSDKDILEFGMKNFYPHLTDLFYFMDFEYSPNNNRPGGSDAIEKNIQAFITSKVKNRFIALFDNDTIGNQSKKSLLYKMKNMPQNFKITTYPNINDARKFPVIMPNNKITLMDINNKACSIEIYLPKNLLLDNNGQLFPIQWKSLIERKIGKEILSDYQGEILNKDTIKKSFVDYKRNIESNKIVFHEDEWLNLKMILDYIIHLFD